MANKTKTIIFSIIVLLFIIFTSIYIENYLKTSTAQLMKYIEISETNINNGDWDSAYKSISELNNKWEKTTDLWALIINHHEIDSIEISLKDTTSFIKSKDKKMALASISSLKHYVGHIPEIEKASLKNIL